MKNLLNFLLALLLISCGTTKQLKDCIPERKEIKIQKREEKREKISDQKLLDMALELCQKANDLWNRGEIEEALDTLDRAYSLILRIDSDDPDVIQQKDDIRITIARRIVEIYSSKFTAAVGNGKEIPLVMNEYVRKAIRIFQTTERRFFIQAYKRSGRYRPMILRKLKEAGLPEELSWLPLIESGFSVRALSRARALGLWQFIASTGYKFGLTRTRWIDERMDPEKSTDAAIAYLKELHQIFGDWLTALAAYNCGEERVLRCIRSQRINYLDSFWDLYTKLPQETAFYVPKFLAVLHIVNNPEKYGFRLPKPDDPIEVEKVLVNKQMHLRDIAKSIGVSYKLMRDLNPELRLNCTPAEPYLLKVPKGKGKILLAKIDEIPQWRPVIYIRHRVKRGESLYILAKRYRTTVRAIMRANRLRKTIIREGSILKIPVGRGSYKKRYYREFVRYKVKKGDSLWNIAQRFGTTTKQILALNRLKSPRLRVGQIIKIPLKRNLATYRVEKGDTPYDIAKKFGMRLSDFLRINNLSPKSYIFPGQIVFVIKK